MDVMQRVEPTRSGTDMAERMVVVGVDGPEASSKALAWAAEQGRLPAATLVHARTLPILSGAACAPAEVIDGAPATIDESIATQVAAVLGRSPEVAVAREVQEGPPQ